MQALKLQEKILNTSTQSRLAKIEINDYDTIDLVFFKQHFELIDELKLNNPKGYYLYIRGQLTEYKGKKQIIIEDKSQVWEE